MFANYRIVLFVAIVAGAFLGFRLVSDSQANVTLKPSLKVTNRLTWELIPSSGMNDLTNTYRAKVPGGWIVTNLFKGNRTGTGMTFVPDADHSWAIHSISGVQSFPAIEASEEQIGPPSAYKPKYDPNTKRLLNPRKTYDKKE